MNIYTHIYMYMCVYIYIYLHSYVSRHRYRCTTISKAYKADHGPLCEASLPRLEKGIQMSKPTVDGSISLVHLRSYSTIFFKQTSTEW